MPRCVICDVELSDAEVQLDAELKTEPCTTCKNIIYETAFSGKFKKDYGVDDNDDMSDDFEPDDAKFAELVERDL